MNRKASIVAGFIAFSVFKIFGILSAVFMGEMGDIPMEKMIPLSLTLILCVGLFGVLLAFIFTKIEQHIPVKSLYFKSLIYFLALNSSLTAFMGFEAFHLVDFVLSTLFSIFASCLFIWTYLKFETKMEA